MPDFVPTQDPNQPIPPVPGDQSDQLPKPVVVTPPVVQPTMLPQPEPPRKTSEQAPVAPSVPPPAPAPLDAGKVTIKILHPVVMWQETQSVLQSIERKLNGRVLSYFTAGSISGGDVKHFYSHLKKIGFQDTLYFIINSGGGDGKSAYRIAALLRSYCKRLVVIVPEIAASAATMLSLAADELIMTPLSFLTAVDTSLLHPLNPKDPKNQPVRVELEEVKRAIGLLKGKTTTEKEEREIYTSIFSYVHPVALGAMERSSNLSEMLCRDILELRNEPLERAKANALIDKLNREYPAHSYPIPRTKAKSLGLKVTDSDSELDGYLASYVNTNRLITEPVRTDFNPSYFREEAILNIVESVGKRFAVRNVLERRLDPIIKGWTTLRDEYKWIAISEVEENGKMVPKLSIVNY